MVDEGLLGVLKLVLEAFRTAHGLGSSGESLNNCNNLGRIVG